MDAVEDTLADIQQAGEQLLADNGYDQYEVSAYSRPGFSCRHNANYWSFGDYLGIGAGAHGKISFPDGRITRYAKTRLPADYLKAEGEQRRCSVRTLAREEIAGEFMLNALRLNQGVLPDRITRTWFVAEQADTFELRSNDHGLPPTALITLSAYMGPWLVSTPMTRSPSLSRSMTSIR